MAISRAASNAEAARLAEEGEALRRRAARQAAAKLKDEAPPADLVQCRVLKHGDGKISMGVHIAGVGDAFYEYNETFPCERSSAEALEARQYVEVSEIAAPEPDSVG
jgi:hypothetical protein